MRFTNSAVVTARSPWIVLLSLSFLIGEAGQVLGQQREESDAEIITAPVPPTFTESPDLNAVSRMVVQMTNGFRREQGLAAVESIPELDETADYFAGFMATNDKYGHTADDQRPSERAKDHGYEFCIVLENIAYQFRSTGFEAKELASGFVEGWKNSPEHRKNMLDPDITQTGVAIALSDETGHFYAVQMFGRPRSASIRFELSNESGVTVHYKLGKKNFALEPRFTRTHEQCRPQELQFLGENKDAKEPHEVVEPRGGDAFAIIRGKEGSATIRRQSPD